MECNAQIRIPSLLQLSAEQVASMVNRRKETRRYFKVLKNINLPKIDITYLDYSHACYNQLLFNEKCDFMNYIRKKHWHPRIVPSVPKYSKNYQFKIKIGTEKVIYISTLADLGLNMLKLDFPAGEYGFYPFAKGYVLKMNDYSPKIEDAIHIFNYRDGDKGLDGTYFREKIENLDQLRLFNQFISEHLSERWWEIIDYPHRAVLDIIEEYINIPVMFYVTKSINVDDLTKITLKYQSLINNCGNINVCWYVFHSENGRIGVAVQQNEYFNMMDDQAGICLLASNGYRAIGNFDINHCYTPADKINDKILNRCHYYECEFNPCSCDFSYKSTIERQYYCGTLSPNTRRRVKETLYYTRSKKC